MEHLVLPDIIMSCNKEVSFCSPLRQRWDLFKLRTENLLRLLGGDPFCANFFLLFDGIIVQLTSEPYVNGLKALLRY